MRIQEDRWYDNIKQIEHDTSLLQGVQAIAGADLQERRKTQSYYDG